MSIVETNQLSKSYGEGSIEVEALKDVAIKIEKGEFVAVMGASGSGKSTLLHLIGCLDYPSSGSISIGGQPISDLSDNDLTLLRRRKIGFIFQFFNLIPILTMEENVALPLLMDGEKKRKIQPRIDEMVSLVNMEERRSHFPDQLSGGEQQRTAIARAMIARPDLILADEPTGNLDSNSSEVVMKLLRHSVDQLNQTIVMVTHDQRDAAYADRVIWIKDGKVDGSKELDAVAADSNKES